MGNSGPTVVEVAARSAGRPLVGTTGPVQLPCPLSLGEAPAAAWRYVTSPSTAGPPSLPADRPRPRRPCRDPPPLRAVRTGPRGDRSTRHGFPATSVAAAGGLGRARARPTLFSTPTPRRHQRPRGSVEERSPLTATAHRHRRRWSAAAGARGPASARLSLGARTAVARAAHRRRRGRRGPPAAAPPAAAAARPLAGRRRAPPASPW